MVSLPSVTPAPQSAHRSRRTIASLLLNIACVTSAELFLKIGATASAKTPSLFGTSALHSPATIVGICFYVAAFLFWIYALRTVPLSLAFNFTTLNHVLVPIFAWTLLREQISLLRWVGIGFVIVGFVLLVPVLARAEDDLPEAKSIA